MMFNYINKDILNIIFEYLNNKEISIFKNSNKYIYKNIVIYEKYKINKLLNNNYYNNYIKNIIFNNKINSKYISDSEIIEKLSNKSYSFIIGKSIYNKDIADVYLFYYDKYLNEYKFKYIFSKSILYFNNLNYLELIYFGGEIFIIDNFKIIIYNLLSEQIREYKIIDNSTEIKSNVKCTTLNNKMFIMQSYWAGMSNPKCYYQYPMNEIIINKDSIIKKKYGNESKLIKSRRFYGKTTFNNKIWIAGGIDNNNNYLNSVEIYDPEIEKWVIDNHNMINKRVNCDLVVIKNNIYAIGGDINSNKFTIECYNNKWNIITEIDINEKIYHRLYLDNKLFLFYSETITDYITYYPSKVISKIYNFENNSWYDYNVDQLFPYNDINIYSVNIIL